MTREKPPNYPVELWDAELAGWFSNETGEVYQGLRITPDDVVLDVGCGMGGIAGFCAAHGAALILTDADPERVATAERNVSAQARSVQAIVSESNPLPIPDATASVVISTEVLEHVDDPTAFLAELVRVGKPGARYLLTVPDPECEKLQVPLAAPAYFAKPNHIRIIGREQFGKMVEDAGLVIERRGSYGFFWAMWWLMFWACGIEFGRGDHPVLDSWKQTWNALLDTEGGLKVKKVMDEFLPKSQVIIAHKP